MIVVSIIIPIYNVEQQISKCINSVIQQDYAGDIECLLIDDCTPDKSLIIAKEIIAGNTKSNITFKIIQHPENRGLSAARNSGIKSSRGEYMFFLDSDDEITPDCISGMVQKIIDITDNIAPDIIQGDGLTSNHDKEMERFISASDKGIDDTLTGNSIIRPIMLRQQLPVTAWNKLIRAGFIKDNNLYFEEGIIHEDECWNFFAAKKANRVCLTGKRSYIYHYNDASITQNKNRKKRFDSIIKIISLFTANIDSDSEKEQRHITEFFIKIMHHEILRDTNEYARESLKDFTRAVRSYASSLPLRYKYRYPRFIIFTMPYGISKKLTTK